MNKKVHLLKSVLETAEEFLGENERSILGEAGGKIEVKYLMNSLSLLKWGLDKGLPLTRNLSRTVMTHGKGDMVRLLKEKGCRFRNECLRIAAVNNNWSTFETYCDGFLCRFIVLSDINWFAHHENLEALEKLRASGVCLISGIMESIQNNKMKSLKFIMEKLDKWPTPYHDRHTLLAVSHGHPEILKYLRSTEYPLGPCPLHSSSISTCCERDDMEMFKVLATEDFGPDTDWIFAHCVVYYGQLRFLRAMRDGSLGRVFSLDPEILDLARRMGHHAIIQALTDWSLGVSLVSE